MTKTNLMNPSLINPQLIAGIAALVSLVAIATVAGYFVNRYRVEKNEALIQAQKEVERAQEEVGGVTVALEKAEVHAASQEKELAMVRAQKADQEGRLRAKVREAAFFKEKLSDEGHKLGEAMAAKNKVGQELLLRNLPILRNAYETFIAELTLKVREIEKECYKGAKRTLGITDYKEIAAPASDNLLHNIFVIIKQGVNNIKLLNTEAYFVVKLLDEELKKQDSNLENFIKENMQDRYDALNAMYNDRSERLLDINSVYTREEAAKFSDEYSKLEIATKHIPDIIKRDDAEESEKAKAEAKQAKKDAKNKKIDNSDVESETLSRTSSDSGIVSTPKKASFFGKRKAKADQHEINSESEADLNSKPEEASAKSLRSLIPSFFTNIMQPKTNIGEVLGVAPAVRPGATPAA